MVNVTLSLQGANGDVISLADDGDFVLTSGVTGFGIPSTSVRIDDSAGDGGTFRNSRRGIRELDLPIVIFGSSRDDLEAKLRRLARLLQDKEGATRVIASYSDGTSVYLDAHYTGGAETQFGDDAGLTWCRWVITLQAPQPYWEVSSSLVTNVTSGNTGRGLLPKLASLKVSSSQTLGLVSVNNVGDVPVYPTWIIRGPITNLEVSNGSVGFKYSGSIAAGSVITIDTKAGTVVNEAGQNFYSALGAAPKLFVLQPGTTNISVNGTDISPDTRVSCYYSPRYEVIH